MTRSKANSDTGYLDILGGNPESMTNTLGKRSYASIQKGKIPQPKGSKKTKTPVFVATNLLETMIRDSQPTRAESHDIYSTLKQGASGLVLAAESAIGLDPIACATFLKKCISQQYKKFNSK